MKKLFFLLILFLASSLFAQNILLEQNVLGDSAISKFGQNRKNFRHFYFGYGIIVGPADSAGSDIKYNSSSITFGYRYKFRLSNFYSIGYNISYTSYKYVLKQDTTKTFPNTMLHNNEKFSMSALGLGLYNRFNYGRRGNRIGKFIDIGAYADWLFGAYHFMKDKQSNGNIIETKIRKLNYVNVFQYGVFANIGFNRYVLTAAYRLSDIFETSYTFSELPRITVGLQIGFHK